MAKLSNFASGTTIRIQEGMADVLYEIAGFNVHGTGTATLVRKTLYSTSAFGSTTLYNGSTLDTLCDTTIYNTYPEKLKKHIKTVNIVCAIAGDTGISLARRCFALSMTEVGLGNNNLVSENSALSFFSTASRRIKNNSGNTASAWWLRSWYSSSSARSVAAAGSLSSSGPSGAIGVVPAFVLPSDRPLEYLMNADGSYNLSYADKIDVDVPFGTYTDRPSGIRTALQYAGAITSLYACNNFDDASPAWEPITNGIDHEFVNTTKTASSWKVGVRVLIDRASAGQAIYLNEFPALVVCT